MLVTYRDLRSKFNFDNREEVIAKLRLCRKAIDSGPFLFEDAYNVLHAITIDCQYKDLRDCAARGLQYMADRVESIHAYLQSEECRSRLYD